MKTVFTAVSFAKAPLLEQGPLAQRIIERGWVWSTNDVDWVAHFRKDFPEEVSAEDAEDEIVEIMGDYYVSSAELKVRAQEWREKLTGERPG